MHSLIYTKLREKIRHIILAFFAKKYKLYDKQKNIIEKR